MGKAPVDAFDMSDPINKKFWDNDVYRNKIENTKKPTHNERFISLLTKHYPKWPDAHSELNNLPLAAENWPRSAGLE